MNQTKFGDGIRSFVSTENLVWGMYKSIKTSSCAIVL